MTNTETVGTERLADQMQLWFFRDLSDEQRVRLLRLCFYPATEFATHSSQQIAFRTLLGTLASRTQSPAEWQVEAILKWVHEDVLPAYGITLEYRDAEMVEGAKEALRAASIPAPERSKDVLRAVREIFKVEYSNDGRVLAVSHDSEALRPMVAMLDAALETPPLHKEGEAVGYVSQSTLDGLRKNKNWGGVWSSAITAKPEPYAENCTIPLYAAPVPVPVTITDQAFDNHQWPLGLRVTKTKGSSWTGRVVGYYSTAMTPVGYAVESENEPGSVQIYPLAALSKPGEQG